MFLHFNHFLALRNNRKIGRSFTPAIISDFKVHERRQRPGLPAREFAAPPRLAGLQEEKRNREENEWEMVSMGEEKGKGRGKGGSEMSGRGEGQNWT